MTLNKARYYVDEYLFKAGYDRNRIKVVDLSIAAKEVLSVINGFDVLGIVDEEFIGALVERLAFPVIGIEEMKLVKKDKKDEKTH